MKLNFIKPRYIVLALINTISVIAIIMISLKYNSIAGSLKYNYAAERWTQGKGGASQISCYFSNDSGFTAENVEAVRNSIASSLSNSGVETNKTVIPDSYYTQLGKFNINCDRNTSYQANVTAVGGRFFLFRDFNLLKGAYFSENDNMHNSIVIDRSLAFKLYGSENVAGFNVYINGVRFVITGVIADPKSKYEKECSGNIPHVYILYQAVGLISADVKNVDSYECIIPEPVDELAYNTVNSIFNESYKDKCLIIKNTDRFSSKVIQKQLKTMKQSVVMDKAIELPYWENASRMAEFDLSILYFIRVLLFIIPSATGLFIAFIFSKRLRYRIVTLKKQKTVPTS